LKPEVSSGDASGDGEMRGSRKGSRKKGSRKGRRSGGRKTREERRHAPEHGLERELAEQGAPQQPPPNQPAEPNVQDPNAKAQAAPELNHRPDAVTYNGQPLHKYGGQEPNGYNGQTPVNGPQVNGQQKPIDPANSPMLNGQQKPVNAAEPVVNNGHSPVMSGQKPVNNGYSPVMSGQKLGHAVTPLKYSANEAPVEQWDPNADVLTIDDPAAAHEVHYGKPVEVVTQPAVVSSRYSFDPPTQYQVTGVVNTSMNDAGTYFVDEDVTAWERKNGVTDM